MNSMKAGILNQLVVAAFAFALPFSAAVAGSCCSGHGGVTGVCVSGFQQCKDKSMSPSCKCTVPAAKEKKAKTTKAKTTNTTKPMQKAAPAKATTTGSKGCCSRHGGVASCDKATGMDMCKDGTTSPTCKCN